MKIIENKKILFYDKLKEIDIWIVNDCEENFKTILDILHFGDNYYFNNKAKGAFFTKRIYAIGNRGCNYGIIFPKTKEYHTINASDFFNFFSL